MSVYASISLYSYFAYTSNKPSSASKNASKPGSNGIDPDRDNDRGFGIE